ncbi:MAG: hypothetical protein AAGA03_05430 [Planctomycetota bacterium]
MTQTTVTVTPARVPVGEGTLTVGGDVHYLPGPVWIEVDPSSRADRIALSADMTDQWLKYLAPLAASSTRVEGVISAQLNEALVVIDDPAQSYVDGRLGIQQLRFNTGPVADNIIRSVNQLRQLANPTPQAPRAPGSTTLVSLVPQTVDFTLAGGVVSHQRLQLEIDRAQVITSGRVALDGRLDLTAQVPLDTRWLGRDLQSLANETIKLPVTGTLSRPNVDSGAITDIAARLAGRMVQGEAESYLRKQLGKGQQKVEEQLYRSLNKLIPNF